MDQQGERRATYAASARRMGELTLAMHRAGIALVAGTDGHSGALVLQRDLQLYQQAGIPAPEVLRVATWQPARIAGVGDILGSIEKGKHADLLLVEGDPTRSVVAPRQAVWVVKGDTAYAPDAVMQAVGMKPFVPAARLEDLCATPGR